MKPLTFPESWVILEIVLDGETTHKVLAGWSGSYLGGASWRLNSGIKEIEDADDGAYYIEGHSGSIYVCNPESEQMSGMMPGILAHFQNALKDTCTIKVVPIKDVLERYSEKKSHTG